ncbi:MAG: hypothetical protein E6Q97_37235 [Desulfurellales bacterium]|nr:MAG: hypothetical protein E6Q97_37235 [Desulfurellales bacterium]
MIDDTKHNLKTPPLVAGENIPMGVLLRIGEDGKVYAAYPAADVFYQSTQDEMNALREQIQKYIRRTREGF